MLITEIITPNLIDINLRVKNKDDAIHTLIERLKKNGIINSAEGFFEAVKERESLTTTAVGFGVAIPHARSKHVNKPGIAIGRCVNFQWDEETDQPVNLIFLLAVPEKVDYPDYMRMLASVSRMLVHEEFRESLNNAKDITEFISVISNGKQYLVNGD